MSQGILLIEPGSESCRKSFRARRRVSWGQAMPLVLEKLGYLGFAVAPAESLRDAGTWERHAAILIPELDPADWDDRAIELAGHGRAQALIELPPAALHSRIGVSSAEPADPRGMVTATEERLVAEVAERCTLRSTRLEPPQSRHVDRAEKLDWQKLRIPITESQAAAWRELGWDAQRWSVSNAADPLAKWTEIDGSNRELAGSGSPGLSDRRLLLDLWLLGPADDGAAVLRKRTPCLAAVGSARGNAGRSDRRDACGRRCR